MHPSILAKRKADAINRIVAAAGTLADRHQLDPTRRAALEPKGIKDPAAVEMMRLEGLANLLDDLAAVTVVTEPEAETKPQADSISPALPPPTLDDFPAHVVEPSEETPVQPPARKTTKRVKKSP